MNKYDWIDLKDEIIYWVTGRQSSWINSYTSVGDRWDEFKQILWRLSRRALYCPLGKHYLKWNSGDPKGIICWRRYSEIEDKE